MLGTLNGALEVREVKMAPADISSIARGINEIRDRVPVLTRIEIDYSLRVPADSREKVDRALETHQAKCPMACSLKESVDITWTANIVEV
jgi:uncharacterized OsmC-like protein